MPRMTGGDAIVDSLLRHGIDTIFGVPGVQMYGLFDAFARNANRLQVINARHEQTTAYMALGYAKSTGKPSAYTVVPGPGVMNTMGALTTAWAMNAPVLCITGQVPSAMIGRTRGQLHEMPDQLATLKTLLKFAERIEHPTEAPQVMARAFEAMVSGRPGPVAVEMPMDMFPASADVTPVEPLGKRAAPDSRCREDRCACQAGRRSEGADDRGRRRRARRRARGAGAGREDRRAGRRLPHRQGHRRFAPSAVADDGGGLQAVGQHRSPDRHRFAPRDPLDPLGAGAGRREGRPHRHRSGRASPARRHRADRGRRRGRYARPHGRGEEEDDPARREAIAAAKAAALAQVSKAQPQYGYLEVIREALGDDGIVVDELTQVAYIGWYGYPVHKPRRSSRPASPARWATASRRRWA